MAPPPITPFKGSTRPRHFRQEQSQHHHHNFNNSATTTSSNNHSTSDDVSMASVGEDSCSLMLSSPPKAARSSRPFRYSGAGPTASRLFADDDDDGSNTDEPENRSPNKSPSSSRHNVISKAARGMIAGGGGSSKNHGGRPQVKPLDLNFELSAADEASASATTSPTESHDAIAARSSGMTKHHRKRQAEHPLLGGRDMSFDEDDSEVNLSADDMYTSPRMSPHPSVYKSPSSFRTLDGRTVQSKNPFSPMLMEDNTTAATSSGTTNSSSGTPGRPNSRHHHNTASIADSLVFPVSLDPGNSAQNSPNGGHDGNNSNPLGPPLLRHKLHKRETTLDSPTARSESFDLNSFTRDGYPNKTGRFSFTGSPIKEVEMGATNAPNDTARAVPSPPQTIHKVRRFKKGDDVVAASHHDPQHHYHHNWRRTKLQVDTSNVDGRSNLGKKTAKGLLPGDEEISPTDVMSFPALPSSPPRNNTRPPPTPTKQPKSSSSTTFYRRRAYTPIHKPTRPPATPERFRRVRSFDDLEFGDDTECSDSEQGGDDLMLLAQHSNRRRPRREPVSRFYSDFDIIGELGKGTFGSVYKVLSRLDGCMYAVKTAHRPARGNADKDRMLKEVYALAALSDQADTATFHIVRYHQAWMEENRLYIQTELCSATLSDEIKRHNVLTEQRRWKFLREILLALEFIHRNGMVHLDIKPENIFIKNDQFKLGDFGLVSKISFHDDVEEGDSRYMSLELLSGDHADLTKSDIFSLGIAFYEICLGSDASLPSSGPQWQALRAADIPFENTAAATPKDMQLIIRQMMNPTIATRPTAGELLKRPQLLSDEQKALLAEKNKVIQANMALVAQSEQLRLLKPPPAFPRKGLLVRANTWNGGN